MAAPSQRYQKKQVLVFSWFAAIALQPSPTTTAAPQEPRVVVHWNAPAACGSRAGLQEHVARFGPARFVDEGESELTVEATVVASGTGVVADIRLETADTVRQRQLAARDCALLTRAIAVVAAVALDPIAVAARVRTRPPPADHVPATLPVVEPAPTLQPRAEPRPQPAPRYTPPVDRRPPASNVEWGSRIGVGVGGLVLPRAGIGLVAAPYVGVRQFHARLAMQYWAPRTTRSVTTRGVGASVQLVSAGLRACPILSTGRWRFPLCGGFDLGVQIGVGRGDALARADRSIGLWSAVIVQPGFDVAVTPRVSLWGAFEGAISLNRPGFHLINGPSVHATGRFGPRGLVGIAIHRHREIL